MSLIVYGNAQTQAQLYYEWLLFLYYTLHVSSCVEVLADHIKRLMSWLIRLINCKVMRMSASVTWITICYHFCTWVACHCSQFSGDWLLFFFGICQIKRQEKSFNSSAILENEMFLWKFFLSSLDSFVQMTDYEKSWLTPLLSNQVCDMSLNCHKVSKRHKQSFLTKCQTVVKKNNKLNRWV